ncbi:hypothetical protein N9P79_00330 [Crocinitomicaceae bacterium]|nr:hypothetical protein [Crocinitomicaceae bacterium]
MLRAKRRRTRTHHPDGNPIFNTMNSTPLQSAYVNVNNNQKRLQNCRCTSCGNPNSGCTCIPLNPNTPFKQKKYCNDKIIRNPILGYRKQLLFTGKLPNGYKTTPSPTINELCDHSKELHAQKKALTKNTVYKDNYAKVCGAFRKDNVTGIDGSGNLIVNNSKFTNANLCGYPQVKKRIQNRNGWMNDKYNYSSKQYLERRCRGFNNLAFNYLSNSSIKGSSNSEFLTGCSNARVHATLSSKTGNKNCSGNCDLSCNNILGLDCTKMNCSQQMDKQGNIICAKKGYTVCEATNNNCKAVYKRSNPRFSKQGAVSGGSRINRLKYQTQLKAQSTRKLIAGQNTNRGSMSFDGHVNSVNGFGGASNGSYPVSLYRNTYPTYKANLSGVCLGKSLTLNGLPQRCKMPKEKPSCRALQTLPQRCNFRCNKIYQHHTLIPPGPIPAPTPVPPTPVPPTNLDTLNIKVGSYKFNSDFSCISDVNPEIWFPLTLGATSSYTNASEYSGTYKKDKTTNYKLYFKEEISSDSFITLACLAFIPIPNPNSGGWIFFNVTGTHDVIDFIKLFIPLLINTLSNQARDDDDGGIATLSGTAPCGTLYTYNKRYGPSYKELGTIFGPEYDYGYAPFSNHDITNILSIPNIPMNSYWADANKRFPSFAGIQEIGSNASGTGGWLDDAQWAPPGINWSPEPPCPDSTVDCLGWPWPLYPNDPNINDYAANIQATMQPGQKNSAITIDITPIN